MFEPIARYVNKNAKDPSAKDLSLALRDNTLSIGNILKMSCIVENIKQHLFLGCRLLHLLRALNTVLIPVKASTGFKPTVATGQQDTFLLVESKDRALVELDKVVQIYEEQHFSVPPKLIVIGNSLTTAAEECMVAYKDILYILPTIVRGIDVLAKLQIVLGLPVSKYSKLVWVFIEQFVYGVASDHGGYLCINKLVQFLNAQPR